MKTLWPLQISYNQFVVAEQMAINFEHNIGYEVLLVAINTLLLVHSESVYCQQYNSLRSKIVCDSFVVNCTLLLQLHIVEVCHFHIVHTQFYTTSKNYNQSVILHWIVLKFLHSQLDQLLAAMLFIKNIYAMLVYTNNYCNYM